MKTTVGIGRMVVVAVVAAAACMRCVPEAWAQGRAGGKEGKSRQERPFPPPANAWDVATIILGCPSDRQITLGLTPAETVEGYVEYGAGAGSFTSATRIQTYSRQVPVQLTLDGLTGDTACQYRFCYRKAGSQDFRKGPVYSFHTQRAAGSGFTFDVQGDSHPERTPKQNDPRLYEQGLLAAARARPDFLICLGDDFSVDSLREVTAASVEGVYRKQLPYLGLLAHSTPLYLVNGNHEQAARCNLDGTASNVAVWAQTARNRLFPQPAPDGFYSGDAEVVPHIGLLRDYYAWTWGDALFVVIDPYWHSAVAVDNVFGGGQKRHDMWGITLGEAQYQWFKQTLERSKARYKFVFAHHVNGTGRGGAELAGGYEWGGQGAGGAWEFAARRPGWSLPIHQLMATNGVSVFFQGHDHVFARQVKDGVIYQTVPSPADASCRLYNKEAFPTGDVLPGSGRLRVTVSPQDARVDYIRSFLPGDGTDGKVEFTYTVPGKGGAG